MPKTGQASVSLWLPCAVSKRNVTPKGLTINIQPTVPDTNLKRDLLKKWNQIPSSSSRALLKLLKKYYHTAVLSLAEEIAILRTRLQERHDFSANINKINTFTQRESERYEDGKKRKISRLLGQRTRNKKVCRRKKAARDIKTRTETTTSTVANISNVPLLSAERDLLLRGMSFFPKPSQIDQFQLKEDIQQFFRRLRLKEFFHDVEGNRNDNHPFKKKSKWTPPAIETQP